MMRTERPSLCGRWSENTVLRRLILSFGLVGMLSGCAAFGIAEGVSVGTTDKLLGDHVISAASGKDCSILRRQSGRTYCKEDEVTHSYNELHCYRNLGGVTCYDRPAFGGSQARVGQNGGQAPTN